MNKFEKKAMAKRAYKALVKMGERGQVVESPDWIVENYPNAEAYSSPWLGSNRPMDDMPSPNEYYFNGANSSWDDPDTLAPQYGEGLFPSIYRNAATLEEIPETDKINREVATNNFHYPRNNTRPFGPLMAPSMAKYQKDKIKYPYAPSIDGLNPYLRSILTGAYKVK